jgi:hypothetical protein
MSQLKATLKQFILKLAIFVSHFQSQQPVSSVSLTSTNIDSGTLAIVEQIAAEYEYYQTCGRW